jgi:hypothetical protein
VIDDVAAKVNESGGVKVVTLSENLAVEGMPAGDHAGAWETSQLMALRPGLVDLTRLPPLPEGVEPAGDKIPPPWMFLPRCEAYGIYGRDPRIWASVHYGRRGTQAVLDGLGKSVSEALGDASYGRDRPPIDWPSDVLRDPEVRYEFLLPREWMQRFEQAPIIYWPLPTSTGPIGEATGRAIDLAAQTGGMVFPAFAYGPARDGKSFALPADIYLASVREAVETLGQMDFRVICLLPTAELDEGVVKVLSDIKDPRGQFHVVVGKPDESRPQRLNEAIHNLVPQCPDIRTLDGTWKVNDRWGVAAISESRYGPREVRVYEHEFEISEAEACKNALLDLGQVANHAEVILNDSPSLVDHRPPYRFIVTGRLEPGSNKLKVVVQHKPQPTLDHWFYRPGPPAMTGPVKLHLWTRGQGARRSGLRQLTALISTLKGHLAFSGPCPRA